MAETVKLDKKGRLVVPKKIREETRIRIDTTLIARAKGEGQIELIDPSILLKKARAIGGKKLAGWREDVHEATKLLAKLAKERHNDETT